MPTPGDWAAVGEGIIAPASSDRTKQQDSRRIASGRRIRGPRITNRQAPRWRKVKSQRFFLVFPPAGDFAVFFAVGFAGPLVDFESFFAGAGACFFGAGLAADRASAFFAAD